MKHIKPLDEEDQVRRNDAFFSDYTDALLLRLVKFVKDDIKTELGMDPYMKLSSHLGGEPVKNRVLDTIVDKLPQFIKDFEK